MRKHRKEKKDKYFCNDQIEMDLRLRAAGGAAES